jgi:hypothetical protein
VRRHTEPIAVQADFKVVNVINGMPSSTVPKYHHRNALENKRRGKPHNCKSERQWKWEGQHVESFGKPFKSLIYPDFFWRPRGTKLHLLVSTSRGQWQLLGGLEQLERKRGTRVLNSERRSKKAKSCGTYLDWVVHTIADLKVLVRVQPAGGWLIHE